jgi:hypothetical protein
MILKIEDFEFAPELYGDRRIVRYRKRGEMNWRKETMTVPADGGLLPASLLQWAKEQEGE